MVKSFELLWRFEKESVNPNSLTSYENEFLERELDEKVKLIANSATFDEAGTLLCELGDIQGIMATLAFKFGVQLSDRQRRIVRDYDRCDVEVVRHDIFRRIKDGVFPWCSGPSYRKTEDL